MADEPEQLSFEKGLDKLERVVKRLEDGEISLEESLRLFEEGVELSQGLRRQLDEAESKVEILMKKGDEYAPKPFSLDDNGG